MRIRIILITAITTLLLIGKQFPAYAQHTPSYLSPNVTWLWPTDASHDISSTFAETRAGHFHAALDIKTWGRRGYPVYATRSGILYRVGVDPYGYGNVVYLRHKDGSFSVYAHLEDFVPKIRHLVDSLRLKTYEFSFDRIMTKYHIYFKQGQTIGYTGSSGIGPPHLHFELRTPEEHPFNPFLTNIRVKDHRPPYVKGLSVEPISEDATIQGKKEIYTERPRRTKYGYDFGTINVSGAVGLGIEAGDHSDGVHNSYAVYRLTLKQDTSVYFASEVDSFSYSNTHEMDLDRIYRLLKYKGEAYQRLYVKDGNTLTFYRHLRNHGVLDLPDGRYRFTITASDFFGNKTNAYVTLVFHNDPPASPATKNKAHPNEKIRKWFWADNWVSMPADESVSLDPNMSGGPNARNVLYEGNSLVIDLRHRDTLDIRLPDRMATLYRMYPGRSQTIFSDDHAISAGFGRNTLYDTLSVYLNNGYRDGLPWFSVLPDIEPVKGKIYMSVRLPDSLLNKPGLGIYSVSARHRGRYDYIASIRNDNYLNARISSFGTYRVMQDTLPPTISHPELIRRHGHWLVAVSVKDNLSGVDNERTVVYCNGVRGIPDFDPEGHRVLYYRPDFKPKAINKLKITVYDHTGNHQTSEFTVTRQGEMRKHAALLSRRAGILVLLIIISLGGCSAPKYTNVSAGDTHTFVPGLPNFNIGAFGYYDEHYMPGLRIDINIPYSSLIFKSAKTSGSFEADFDLELKITRKDTTNAAPIVKSYEKKIVVNNYATSRSLKDYPIHFRTILVPGTYDIQAVLLDQNSGKQNQQSLRTTIPNPTKNQVTTTSIELLSKGEKSDASASFEPVLTYHVSQDVDSLKAAIQLFLNTKNNNLNLKMTLYKFRADSIPARPPYYATPMQGSLQYRGIDFGKADTIQVTTRNYSGLAGAISINFLLPKLKQGIYRASIVGVDKANNISFVRSRDFAVREPGFPRLTNLNELAEATYYIATPKEYKRLMHYYNTDSLKQAFDSFWANLIPNKHKAKATISSYYNRVEDANMLFSNYKEGWKTDPGMIYIVFGPPSYVDRDAEGMAWYYQQYSSDISSTFYFQQVINTSNFFPFNHYLLQRNIYYQQAYYSKVQDWRAGITSY